MSVMTPRERLRAALEHKQPDRVPIDLGSIVTGITDVAHRNLRKHLDIDGKEEIIDRIQQLARPEEKLLTRLGVDTRYVFMRASRDFQDIELPDEVYEDEWGVRRKRAHLRTGGSYYDIVQSPFAEATLDDLRKAKWPDAHVASRYEGIAEDARRLHEETDYAIIVNAIGSVFEFSWYLRGYMQFMMDLAWNQDFAAYLMDRMLEFQIGLFEEILDRAGQYVDVVLVGDDLGTQHGPAISLDVYRKLVKPRQKALYDAIKKRTNAKLFYHCCGSARAFLPDLIEIGVDIINPVQVQAAGMDPVELKREFGRDLTFWGGIDTQRVLPFGTPQEVADEVRRMLDIMAKDGGFVLNSVHNIQSDVPPENALAMFDAALAYAG